MGKRKSNSNNKIIQPQTKEYKYNKKTKLKAVDARSSKAKKQTSNSDRFNLGNNKTKNKKNKNKKTSKSSVNFNNLKFAQVLTKLQIGFIIILVSMVLFKKFDVVETMIKDEVSVFGEQKNSYENENTNSETKEVIATTDVEVEQNFENKLVGTSDVEFDNLANSANNSIVSYMKGNTYNEIFKDTYVVDSRAGVVDSMFDFETFESKDLTLNEPTDSEPKVLIFHTHGSEQYKDSKGIEEGVYLLGRTLENELEEKYGINTLHIEKRYDMVDGRTQILGAYERMEPDILATLKKYPSIEVVIDIHRDGLPGDMKQTVELDGEKYAPLMFVNGLSSFNNKGVVEPLTNLKNPNLEDNLSFSYRMKQELDKRYDGLMKDIYINAYRYSLHMKPKSLLLEVGAQNNTVDESVRSTKLFAKTLAEVLKGE